MMITIQKWRNSQIIRIPKTILDEVNWSVFDNIELTTENNTINKFTLYIPLDYRAKHIM